MDTTEFLKSLELAIGVPTYQPRFTSDDQLSLAYDEQKLRVVPLMLGVRQNYFLVMHRVPVLVGQKEITFPARTVGRAAKNVYWISDVEIGRVELTRYEESQINRWREEDKGTPSGFTLRNDSIRVWPAPDEAATAEFAIYCKPSKPVSTKRTATVRAVGVDTLTVSMVPQNIVIGSVCDITRAQPGYNLVYMDQVVSGIAGNVITLSGFSALNPITGVSVGDSLSLAGETSILQMIEEASDVLVQATAVRILYSLGVPDQLKMAKELLDQKEMNLREVVEPRIEDQPTILFHGHPLLGAAIPIIPRVTVPQ